jgi:hypothetical protein
VKERLVFYWKIMRDTPQGPQLIGGGLTGYATEELAREASRQERLLFGWTMADGYYDVVEEAKDS